MTKKWVPKPTTLSPQVDEEGFQMVQPTRTKNQNVNTPERPPPDLQPTQQIVHLTQKQPT